MENKLSVHSLTSNNRKEPLFGVAGYPPNFALSSYGKKREKIFQWLQEINLDWVELQNTYGVKMSDEQASLYYRLAKDHHIGVSIHGPYYITLASGDKDVVKRSIHRIEQCFHLAEMLHANRIVFHPGFYPGKTNEDRRAGINQIIKVLNSMRNDVPKGVFLYPETAGKRSQIGSLEEVIELCESVEFARPCLDLAHIHGFTGGALIGVESIKAVFSLVGSRLGTDRLDSMHIHMYPIEYDHNGEKRHKAFGDKLDSTLPPDRKNSFFPRADDFINALRDMNLAPVIICEAKDTQDVGARLMKSLYYGELSDEVSL